MNLREQAAADLRAFLEDGGAGFGWPITLTDPNGIEARLVGYTNDIGQTIDPETGVAVAGRSAHCTLSLEALSECADFTSEPQGVPSESLKPWVVSFAGLPHAEGRCDFKVVTALPDRTIGALVLLLEAYIPRIV